MVQAAESRKGLNLAFSLRANFCRPTCWRVLREPKMSPVLMIVEQVRKHQGIALGALATIAQGIRRSAKRRKFKTEAELDKALEEVRGIRYKMRPAIAEALTKMKDLLPQKKRGPRPNLTDSQKQAACSTINTLKDNGMTIKFAIEQTAKNYKVTPRKMRSVWESSGRK